MAYDEELAERVRHAVGPRPDVTERKMFGGVAFLLDGKMFCGLAKSKLMVRVGPERHQQALAEAHVSPMDFTGRPMNGYVYVEPEGCRTMKAVKKWVDRAIAFVGTLPAGSKRPARRKPAQWPRLQARKR
jgi:TfoX/Sxy family transcriptional regulator of competence genes